MPIGSAAFLLDPASPGGVGPVLYGGARFAPAGGGLPARVTTERQRILDTSLNMLAAIPSRTDENIVFISRGNSNGVTVHDIAANTYTSIAGIPGDPRGIHLNADGSQLYVVTTGNMNVYVVDTATRAVVATYNCSGLGGGVNLLIAFPSMVSGRMWVMSSSNTNTGTLHEVAFAAPTVSIRVAPGGVALRSALSTFDGNLWTVAASLISRINEAVNPTVTAEEWAASTAYSRQDGIFGVWVQIYADPDGGVYVQSAGTTPFHVFKLTPGDTGVDSYQLAIDSQPNDGGPALISSTNTQSRPMIAISNRYVAMRTRAPGTTGTNDIALMNRQNHGAIWSWTAPVTGALVGLEVPGNFGNEYGTQGAEYGFRDRRRTRFFMTVNGGSAVEVYPGARLSQAIVAGQVVTVEARFNLWMKKMGPHPYVGDPTGVHGPRLWYDYVVVDADAPTPIAGLRGKLGVSGLIKGRLI